MDNSRKHFGLIACHVLWRELFHFSSKSEHIIHPHFLKLGLHDTPDKMRSEIQALIDAADCEGYEALLLGYGLCGNGTLGLKAGNTPLVMMRGHDCITFLLGSKEEYRSHIDAEPGTYWYSPGWIDNDRVPGMEQDEKYRREYTEKYDAEQAEMMVQLYRDSLNGYKFAKYIDQGLFESALYQSYTSRNAEYLGLSYENVPGDSGLIEDFINGRWDDERFLVVQPGQKVELSVGEEIVKAG